MTEKRHNLTSGFRSRFPHKNPAVAISMRAGNRRWRALATFPQAPTTIQATADRLATWADDNNKNDNAKLVPQFILDIE